MLGFRILLLLFFCPDLNAGSIKVDWLIEKYIPEVLELESHKSDPKNYEYFDTMRGREKFTGQVALQDNKVVGSLLYKMDSGAIRIGYFSAVSDQVSEALIERMIAKLNPQISNRLDMDVRKDDLMTLSNLRNAGFFDDGNGESNDDIRLALKVPKMPHNLTQEEIIHEFSKLNFYERMGLPELAGSASVETARKKMKRVYSTGVWDLIDEAAHVLGDDARKKAYDRERHTLERMKASPQLASSKHEKLNSVPEIHEYSRNSLSDDFYQRLGVPENANRDRIVNTYVNFRKSFGLRHKSKQDLDELRRVSEAYETLSERRLRYDYDSKRIETERDREGRLEVAPPQPSQDPELNTTPSTLKGAEDHQPKIGTSKMSSDLAVLTNHSDSLSTEAEKVDSEVERYRAIIERTRRKNGFFMRSPPLELMAMYGAALETVGLTYLLTGIPTLKTALWSLAGGEGSGWNNVAGAAVLLTIPYASVLIPNWYRTLKLKKLQKQVRHLEERSNTLRSQSDTCGRDFSALSE